MARSRPSDSSDSDADGSDGAVETLVAGRERRSQAGEGLKALIQDEEGDEIDLLFRQTMDEEDADDDFLDHDEAGSGDDMDESSSSSEDEQDETSPAADENSGEKVLERAEKAERLKRRRQLREPWRRPPSARTQATAASTDAGKTPVPGSSRSSDRTGPLSRPSHIVHGPVRSSLRKLTVQNRHETNKRVEESKERRKQQEQAMEAAVHRRQSAKPKALSQADRLAEAARVEQLNSKSLNRWERAESRRIEEQKAKSVALRSRRPDGPVVTWLSRPSLWTQESLVASGAGDVQKYFQTHPNLCVSSDLSKLSPVQHDPTNVDQGGAASSSREVARSTLTFGKRTSPSNEPRNEKMLPSEAPGTRDHVQIAASNLLVLPSSSSNAAQHNDAQSNILTQRKKSHGRSQRSHAEPCAITGLRARFRDPRTSLPYASSLAFKEMGKLSAGKPQWSNLFGCYIDASSG